MLKFIFKNLILFGCIASCRKNQNDNFSTTNAKKELSLIDEDDFTKNENSEKYLWKKILETHIFGDDKNKISKMECYQKENYLIEIYDNSKRTSEESFLQNKKRLDSCDSQIFLKFEIDQEIKNNILNCRKKPKNIYGEKIVLLQQNWKNYCDILFDTFNNENFSREDFKYMLLKKGSMLPDPLLFIMHEAQNENDSEKILLNEKKQNKIIEKSINDSIIATIQCSRSLEDPENKITLEFLDALDKCWNEDDH